MIKAKNMGKRQVDESTPKGSRLRQQLYFLKKLNSKKMKKIFPGFLSFMAVTGLNAQNNTTTSVDLSSYCPYAKVQYKSTCYSYAVAYTALSTTYNITNNVIDPDSINRNYFSAGYVSSYHNSGLSLLKRSRHCGRNGTAAKALDILKDTGTVKENVFGCGCTNFKKLRKEVPAGTLNYKITDYYSLDINCIDTAPARQWIKAALGSAHPVIITLYQDRFLNNNK